MTFQSTRTVIFYIAFLFSVSGASANQDELPKPLTGSDPAALKCAENFLTQFEKVNQLEADLSKREWTSEGKVLHDEKLTFFYQSPNTHSVRYNEEGSSGIKNNGMTVTYSGGNQALVKFGKPNVWGFLMNSVASLVVGEKMDVFGSRML